MLLHFCPVGVTLSWEEAHPGARASRPHKSSRSFAHLLHRNQPAAAPCLCFGRAHAVPAGRAVGCNIAGKLSGNPRDSMRAGRPRSRGYRLDGEVGGIRRAIQASRLRKKSCASCEMNRFPATRRRRLFQALAPRGRIIRNRGVSGTLSISLQPLFFQSLEPSRDWADPSRRRPEHE